ncbi:hypothetical protein BTO06_02480 [Tenacibaculum sp. SZ-18]|uniref:hypothetical protein n=1 Tax=Tenacibaculum sp. SZ-18 TaxID=754423 RepID=UPI000C2D0225|nr:hypothetical protein [Tenacibaculum sp. SZ-18]AUC14094.1 hypothetical protein BTO06_02480 [Tenacibaculum sp. SZ-18]
MFDKLSLFILFIVVGGYGQHDFSTYNAHKSLLKSIKVSDEVIEGRTAFFEKQAEEKPLMFQKTRVRIGELNRLANNLSKFIVNTQKEVNTERVIYDLLDDDFYRKILFKHNGSLTKEGKKLKIKIDSLYDISIRVNVHRLSQLENFSEDHFKTNGEYYDHDGNQISFFDQLFYDKTNYGIMMSMNYLLLDVKTFQLLYYGTVMSY